MRSGADSLDLFGYWISDAGSLAATFTHCLSVYILNDFPPILAFFLQILLSL